MMQSCNWGLVFFSRSFDDQTSYNMHNYKHITCTREYIIRLSSDSNEDNQESPFSFASPSGRNIPLYILSLSLSGFLRQFCSPPMLTEIFFSLLLSYTLYLSLSHRLFFSFFFRAEVRVCYIKAVCFSHSQEKALTPFFPIHSNILFFLLSLSLKIY